MMRDSVKRLAMVKEHGGTVDAPRFYWWEAEDFKRMAEVIEKMGDRLSHVQAVPGLDAEGRPDMHIRLVEKGEAPEDDRVVFNFSHPCCPHECPPDWPPC